VSGVLVWDDAGNKKYETGVDHCVLYPLNPETVAYDDGVAWNGITAVNEKPGGASQNPQYADNIKYLNLTAIETFDGTIEAFTFPDAWNACDGSVEPEPGVSVGQQPRQTFGLCYRTKIGNDNTPNLGEKLHLVYGAIASPSEKDFATINDSPAAVGFSWDFTTIPVNVTGQQPTSLIIIDSTTVDATAYGDLKDLLYGTEGTTAGLPLPDDVIALFAGSITSVTPTVPTISSDVITIPTVTGVQYLIGGVVKTGTVTITVDTVVHARTTPGHVFTKPVVTEWLFRHT
jgi:hypothetical protein